MSTKLRKVNQFFLENDLQQSVFHLFFLPNTFPLKTQTFSKFRWNDFEEINFSYTTSKFYKKLSWNRNENVSTDNVQYLLSNALNSSLGIRQKPGFKGQKWSAEVVELPVSISRETDERVVTQQDIKTWHPLIKLPTIF